MKHLFPAMILSLPQADVAVPKVTGWLLQGTTHQGVFFRLEPGMEIPEHAHGAQCGFVLGGELELTVSGETRTYRPGDSYEIPAGAPHCAKAPSGALAFDLFEDAARYRRKS